MTRLPSILVALVLTLATGLTLPGTASAQAEDPRADPKLRVFAAATLDVASLHEEMDVLLARPDNKTVERQAEIRAEVGARIAQAIEARGLTRAEYDRLESLVTTDPRWRAAFERWVEQARGARSGR